MKYMLDTNICIEIIRKKNCDVIQEFENHISDGFCISAVTYSELLFGCVKSLNYEKNFKALEKFLTPIEVLDYPSEAAHHYAQIRSDLELSGTPIGPNDTLISAHCLFSSCVLVTNNEREFVRVPELIVQNWVRKKSQ